MNRKGLVKGILLVYFARSLYGGQIIENINVSSRDINFSKNGMYDVVKLKGCNLSRVPGFPVLPEKVVRILIPSEADIKGVKIMSSRVESIPGRYYIYPAQKSYPISGKKKTATIKFDSAIYKRNSNFPAEIIKYSNTGNMGGYKIASFLIYPIQYNPVQKKLILNSDIQILVSYDENISQSTESVQHPVFRRVVSSNVINPEGIKDYNAGVKSKFGAIEYVIITTDSFISSFQFLADWKTKKGVPAKIVTLDSIYINYSGRDNAEKVRNFIKYTNINWGAIWFLLGGQCDYENGHQIVPRRDVYYISASEGAYNDEDTIPSDLYFSDLDGTWNNDNDAIWGEAPEDGDTVDLYGDVFVGRVPARNKLQVQNFVNKVLTYEKNPPSGYLKRMFFPTAELFDPTHDGTISQEIISSFMPSGWQGIKLYERGGNLTRARTIDTIKSGVGFSHMVGHGNENGIYLYVGGSYLNSSNADTLKNGNKLCIINSIACFTGAMDEVVFGDCLLNVS